MTTTWDKIAAVLQPYGLKKVGREEWRSNRPWSSKKSDSLGLTIKVLPDGEYGAYKDHVEETSGSLYELAVRLNVELPQRDPITPTKRGYTGLADYAEAHGAPVEAFEGWKEVQCNHRPALHFTVDGQDRYRFIDGAPGKENFYWKKGSHPALYGWARAVDMARKTNRKPVYVNGAATVRVGQWYGIPAFTVEGGEHVIPDPLIDQLVADWDGEFIFALDSDYTGQNAMYGSVAKLAAKGRAARNADLMLMDRGDLCDFRKLHGENTYAELERRAVVPKAGEEPIPSISAVAQDAAALEKQVKAANADPKEELAKQAAKLEAQVERITAAIAPARTLEFHELAEDTARNDARRWPQLHMPELAALVGPLEPGQYVFYAATNMGKSWMAGSIGASLARHGTGLIITTETSPLNFFRRMASFISRVPLVRINDGTATPAELAEWKKAAASFKSFEGRVMDMSSPTPKQVSVEAYRARKEIGLNWMIVDSATRMQGVGDSVYERTSSIANGLQNLARDLNIPIIMTSQVGRDVTDRPRGKRMPRLDDAYGSGAIEQNADAVIGLYRHEYYVVKGLEEPDEITYPPGSARLELLKHRNRPIPDQPWCTVMYDAGCGFYPRPTEKRSWANLNAVAGVAS